MKNIHDDLKSIEIDYTSNQINFLDSRFYRRNNKYYPSITNILQYFPKGKFFETWLKDVGHNSEFIAKKSADEGTQTHKLIEKYLNKEQINWLDENDQAICSLNVWQMLLRFVDFWETEKPELIHSEIHLFSDQYEIAGTCDLVVKLHNKMWILDIKTSNNLHTSYDLQLAAYAKCWDENYEEKIDSTGVLWLKSSKHKPDKTGKKIQGKGWELYVSSRSIQDNWDLFMKIYDLYKLENPKIEPIYNQFPISVKLNF